MEIANATNQSTRRLVTVDNAAKLFSDAGLTAGAIRAYIYKAETRTTKGGHSITGNGLAESGAIYRIGRKVLIDPDRFGAWMEKRVCVTQR